MKSRAARQNAATREAIRAAAPDQFLIETMLGHKAPVRDEVGRITGYTEPAELGQRIDIAKALLKKVMPDLSASAVDISSNGDSVMRLVLSDGLLPPGIEHQEQLNIDQNEIDHKTINAEVSPPQNSVDCEPAPDEGFIGLQPTSGVGTPDNDTDQPTVASLVAEDDGAVPFPQDETIDLKTKTLGPSKLPGPDTSTIDAAPANRRSDDNDAIPAHERTRKRSKARSAAVSEPQAPDADLSTAEIATRIRRRKKRVTPDG